MSDVLVTGAAGFLGSHLVDALLAAGHSVTGVDDLSGGYADNVVKHERYLFVKVSMLSDNLQLVVDKNLDAVYHCAATAYEGLSVFSPAAITENILVGTMRVAAAAINAGVKRFINCSSAARYGDQKTPYCEDYSPPCPNDPYGLAKVAAERCLNLLGETHGMTVVHAVPHNIIGSRQRYDDPYRNVASIMTNLMLQGKPVFIYGDGDQQRCFSHVSDVLPVLLQLLDAKVDHGEVFNVGPDEELVTINHLFCTLAELTGYDSTPWYLPRRPREVKVSHCSSDKIRERFGYKTRTNLRDGLQTIVDYVRRRGIRPFVYDRRLEIRSELTPDTWKNRLF